MPTLIRFLLICICLLGPGQSFGTCQDISIEGFKYFTEKNAVKVLMNQQKSVSFGYRCQKMIISKSEALSEFSKLGAYQNPAANIYKIEKKVAGVTSIEYLVIGESMYQASLIYKNKLDDSEKIQKLILKALTAI